MTPEQRTAIYAAVPALATVLVAFGTVTETQAAALIVSAVTVSVLDYLAQTRRSEKFEVWADRAHKTALLVALVVVIALGALIVRIAWVGR